MPDHIVDVAIVGGGVIGCAVAAFLARDPAFGGTVLVVERDPGYTACSTTLSVGSVRQQFSTPENIEMSRFAVDFVRNIGDYLALDDEPPPIDVPDVHFVEAGYLFLATPAGVPALRANHAVQRSHGAAIALLDDAALRARYPWLDTDGIAAGSLGLEGEGWLDPSALLHGFRRKARSMGVTFLHDEVAGLNREGGRVTALALKSGRTVACGAVVNAAGPRAADVAAMAGSDLPVRPRKRIVYVFDSRTPVPGCPLVILPNGVYVRPEGGFFVCGVSPPADRDPDCLDLEVEYDLYDEIVWPALAERIPAFEAIKLIRAWAGHYAYNTFDQNAILGPHPEAGNFYFANGFSGHGLQQSPAVGRAIAELIVHGGYRTLDLGRFGYDRIVANRPIRELNVV